MSIDAWVPLPCFSVSWNPLKVIAYGYSGLNRPQLWHEPGSSFGGDGLVEEIKLGRQSFHWIHWNMADFRGHDAQNSEYTWYELMSLPWMFFSMPLHCVLLVWRTVLSLQSFSLPWWLLAVYWTQWFAGRCWMGEGCVLQEYDATESLDWYSLKST